MLRERLAENIGTAGDSEVMSLNANSRVVVSVPADTKIYVVFTKHEQSPSDSPAALVMDRYSKGAPFEQLLYGGFASLMCSGMLRALEGFVQHTGATNADVFWMATMSLANWTANVILPMFALTQLVAMALHMGGVVSEIYPGSTWIRKFIAAIAALSVSGIMRLAESMVTQAHGVGG